jgi:hypothetical protein
MYDRSFLEDFSATFPAARQKFLDACRDAAILETSPHPLKGPDGEELATDIAYFGRIDAPYLIVSVSGTHGVEGWAGSACQTGWARRDLALPDDVAMLHIHAINPWGMAWDRRQQEDNVDLNRHYVDFACVPANPDYAKLYEHVMCPEDDTNRRSAADAALAAYREKHGRLTSGMTLQGGQYSFPDAPSYGGSAPVWSRRMIDEIFARYCGKARRVAVVDIHTGYGPYGYGIPLWHMPGGPQLEKARTLFGPTIEAPLAGDRAHEEFIQHGHFYGYCERQIAKADVIAMCLEFGGEWLADGQRARLERNDALLWRDGDPLSAEARAARRRWRDLHCPESDDWREMVWFRGRQVFREMVERIRLDDETSMPEMNQA